MKENKKILVVEVNWLGDVLFSTAAIRALREKFPGSFIACLVHQRCYDILSGNPNIDEVIVLDEKVKHGGVFGKLRLINELKTRHFDTVYLFHRSFTRAVICFLSGIKERISYDTSKARFLLTDSVPVPKEIIHRAAYYYYLVTQRVSKDKDELHSDFFIANEDSFFVKNVLKKEGLGSEDKLVAISPFGNWYPKRWAGENFSLLADRLIEEFKAKIIFCGPAQDRELVAGIISKMRHKAVNLGGTLNLKQLGAFFKEANLVIAADTGPLHIAVGLGRPIVALFGPTSSVITGPLSEKDVVFLQKETGCRIPCYQENCQDNRCMKQISVEDVLVAIKEKKWLETTK